MTPSTFCDNSADAVCSVSNRYGFLSNLDDADYFTSLTECNEGNPVRKQKRKKNVSPDEQKLSFMWSKKKGSFFVTIVSCVLYISF